MRRFLSASLAAILVVVAALLALFLASLLLGVSVEMLGTILVGLGIIPTTLFVFRYLMVRWWESIAGQNMIAITAIIDMFLIEEFYVRVAGRPDWHDGFVMVMLTAVVVFMWQRFIMLLWAQREVARPSRHADAGSAAEHQGAN